jgi:hypothetical protein
MWKTIWNLLATTGISLYTLLIPSWSIKGYIHCHTGLGSWREYTGSPTGVVIIALECSRYYAYHCSWVPRGPVIPTSARIGSQGSGRFHSFSNYPRDYTGERITDNPQTTWPLINQLSCTGEHGGDKVIGYDWDSWAIHPNNSTMGHI